jgi:transcription initiation factor TFIIH subunit 2
MADSDGEYVHDASDDEFNPGKSSYGTRAHGSGGKRQREKPRKQQAWETSAALRTGEKPVEEAPDGTIQLSVREREEERKRKR